jgi:GTP-binding protein YchF
VGKSTLFNALTKNNVLAANYPFATIEPNVGVVGVPDPRLAQLATVFGSEKLLPAVVSFVDIAGIVKGASEGAGLGNKFLANIRETDAICQVIRVFSDENVTREGERAAAFVDPASDIEVINTELALADLQTIEKAIPRLEKEARIQKEKAAVVEEIKKAQVILNEGKLLYCSKIDLALIAELQLMTTKPFLYVFNVDAQELGDAELRAKLQAMVAPSEAILLDAKTEAELSELDDADAMELLEAIGLSEPGLTTLARVGFDTLGLQTYLTAGPKEARAWTIHKGDTAPMAAGVIHTDFQKGFIKAEIVSYNDLIAAGSMTEARANGKVRMEGKDYAMQDGDVVEFRFNV